jgi:hypothetical protein
LPLGNATSEVDKGGRLGQTNLVTEVRERIESNRGYILILIRVAVMTSELGCLVYSPCFYRDQQVEYVWGRCVGTLTWAPVDGKRVVIIINGVMGKETCCLPRLEGWLVREDSAWTDVCLIWYAVVLARVWHSSSTRRTVKGDAAASAPLRRTVIEPGGVVLREGGDSDNASCTSSVAQDQARGCGSNTVRHRLRGRLVRCWMAQEDTEPFSLG